MPDTFLLIQMFVVLAVIGGFAGVLAGLLGVGGGIVLVPAFFYAFQTLGYDGPDLMQMCLATSLATIIVAGTAGAMAGNIVWYVIARWLGIDAEPTEREPAPEAESRGPSLGARLSALVGPPAAGAVEDHDGRRGDHTRDGHMEPATSDSMVAPGGARPVLFDQDSAFG